MKLSTKQDWGNDAMVVEIRIAMHDFTNAGLDINTDQKMSVAQTLRALADFAQQLEGKQQKQTKGANARTEQHDK